MASKKIVDNFVIQRSKWCRGQFGSALLVSRQSKKYAIVEDPDVKVKVGTMCCLGFYLSHKGIGVNSLRGYSAPEDLNPNILKKVPDWLLTGESNSEDGGALMEVNDSPSISEAQREKKVTQLFRKQGIEVKFVD